MKEYKKISECSTNDTTVFLIKIQCSFVCYVQRFRHDAGDSRNGEGMKFSLLRNSIEFPVTVYNNIDGKFDINENQVWQI